MISGSCGELEKIKNPGIERHDELLKYERSINFA